MGNGLHQSSERDETTREGYRRDVDAVDDIPLLVQHGEGVRYEGVAV